MGETRSVYIILAKEPHWKAIIETKKWMEK
jgi:hypothetical protein